MIISRLEEQCPLQTGRPPPATQDYADTGDLLTALTSGSKAMIGITRTSA
jgi:hypothetical protein